ncbi:transposase, partial [Rhizobium sp. SEMIA 4085]|uniref:transposase n=1 Tax=Rhizobium sp. SEMIA 4085 TaxID=2137761 RepID=UPI00147866F9
VERCLAQGLVGAEGFAVDASLIAADANKQRSVPGAEWEIKDDARRSVQEDLAVLDDAAFGAASPVTPKFISPSDPAAQWTGAHKGHAFFAYATNYLIDTDHGVIVDVEATRAIRQAEVGASRTMIDRTENRFGLKPDYLAADSAYGSADNLAWLVKEKDIAPHIPVFDKSNRTDGTFSRSDFTWEAENDRYICPAGKELKQFHRTYATPRSGITSDGRRLYRASKKDCDGCEIKQRCCPNAVARKVPRDLNEDARDVARAIAATPEYEQSRHRRKKVEMLFAHLKRILRMARLRLRGPCGARDEFLLAATAQNLRRLAKLRPQRSPHGIIAV